MNKLSEYLFAVVPVRFRGEVERVAGVEPASSAWKAEVIAIIRYPLLSTAMAEKKHVGRN